MRRRRERVVPALFLPTLEGTTRRGAERRIGGIREGGGGGVWHRRRGRTGTRRVIGVIPETIDDLQIRRAARRAAGSRLAMMREHPLANADWKIVDDEEKRCRNVLDHSRSVFLTIFRGRCRRCGCRERCGRCVIIAHNLEGGSLRHRQFVRVF